MTASKFSVAAVQMNSSRDVGENARRIAAVLRTEAAGRPDAVLFPECAVTGYSADFDRVRHGEIEAALRLIGDAARQSRRHVLVGCPCFEGRKRLNCLVVFDRRGREVFRYAKIHLTARDAHWFTPGNALAYFHLDGVACTAIICHERRYPELVRLPVMMGAQIIFHPNAGLDPLPISKRKRSGRDGIAGRAFENEIYYVFANTVGRQAPGLWSAGDSKIVGPDSQVLALADHRRETIIYAELDLKKAGRKYAREALVHPQFLRAHWQRMLAACRRRVGP